jgi:hypothetical protein
MPDLSDAVDFIVLFPNTLNLRAQIRVPFGTIRGQVWVFEDRCMRIECPLSAMQASPAGQWTGRLAKPCKSARHLSHLDDLPLSSILRIDCRAVDEGNHRLKGRASSVPLPGSRLLANDERGRKIC